MKPNLVSILANPERDWRAFRARAEGASRFAYRKLDVDWNVYNVRDYLFTHDTIVASVATEPDGFTIKKRCWELVNANGNAWTNEVLLCCYKTFIGGENYCFPEGTRVLMSDGTYKPIEEIKEGDKVINAKGEIDEVVNTFSHSYTGKMVKFKSPNILSKELNCTAEHPFYVYSDRGTSAVSGKPIKPQRQKERPNYDDVGLAAGERRGDLTESRWGHPQYVNAIVLDEERSLLVHPISNLVVENEEINENRAFLIGWFLAEGSYVHGTRGIAFALSKDEKNVADEICRLLEIEFPEKCLSDISNAKDKEEFIAGAKSKHAKWLVGKHPKTGEDSWISIYYYSSKANEFFRKWCNEYAWAKCLPEEAMTLPLNLQKIILMQYMAGDGCDTIGSKGACVSSKSEKLIQQMRFIAIRLDTFPIYRKIGVLPRYTDEALKDGYPVFIDPNTGKVSRPGYELDFNCDDWYKLSGSKKPKHSSYSTRFEDNFVFRFKKEESDVSELMVYNFETRNHHSYVVEGVAVHNCEHVQVPSLSKGKILDAVIREVIHNGERIYVVDILVATNRVHADLVRRIESGELNTLSMGANAKYVQCSVCGKLIDTVKDEPSCEHLANHIGEVVEYKGRHVKCAELCGGIDPKTKEYIKGSCTFIEASWVECPAFEGAVTNFIIETPEIRKRRDETAALENLFRASSLSSLRVADAKGRMQLNVAMRLMAETEHVERLRYLEASVANQIIKRCNNCINIDS